MSTRVLLVDDHREFRQTARKFLELEGFVVLAEAGDCQAALRSIRRLRPDVVLLDLAMPGASGLQTAVQVQQDSPGTRMILLTSEDEVCYMAEALLAGIRGYVVKSRAAGELAEAIRTVMLGSIYLPEARHKDVIKALLELEQAHPADTGDRNQLVQAAQAGVSERWQRNK